MIAAAAAATIVGNVVFAADQHAPPSLVGARTCNAAVATRTQPHTSDSADGMMQCEVVSDVIAAVCASALCCSIGQAKKRWLTHCAHCTEWSSATAAASTSVVIKATGKAATASTAVSTAAVLQLNQDTTRIAQR